MNSWSLFYRKYPKMFICFVLVLMACGGERSVLSQSQDSSTDMVDVFVEPQTHDASTKEVKLEGGSVWHHENGAWVAISKKTAQEKGLFVLDLSDEWAPFIFSELTPGQEGHKENYYRKIFIGLANDQNDNEGKPLKKGRHNYLELFGVFPTLSVLKKRAIGELDKTCYEKIDYSVFSEKLPYPVRYDGQKSDKRYKQRYLNRKRKIKEMMRKVGIKNEPEFLEKRKASWEVKAYKKVSRVYHALLEAQKRLVCEGLLRKKRMKVGVMDWQTHQALKRFERKHKIFGWGMIWKETREVLARSPDENLHNAIIRVLRERIANQVPVIEDGTVRIDGKKKPRNIVEEFTKEAVKQMGIVDVAPGIDFLRKPPVDSFKEFKVAVKFPKLPDYYSEKMKFSVTIKRGDVWYEFPYDEKGNEKPQPRALRPWIVLYAHHKGKKIPLVQWPTTIGGWRSEQYKGHEYWSYKNSSTGQWLWKYVVAAPVWFPPLSTPPRDLVKKVRKGGRWRTVVKKEEMGPGYASAYGLVAAFHTQERKRGSLVEDIDHGIRTHGSVSYMSIRRNHSHGCHRLYNHLAIRLHSFLLQRHKHERVGQVDKTWTLPFFYKEKRYVVQLDTRGYYYRYVPPIPVLTTRGRIRGKVKQPIRKLMKKAGVEYPIKDAGVEDSDSGIIDGVIKAKDASMNDAGVPNGATDARDDS